MRLWSQSWLAHGKKDVDLRSKNPEAIIINVPCVSALKSSLIICLSTATSIGITQRTDHGIKMYIYIIRKPCVFSFKKLVGQVPTCMIYCNCITARNLATRVTTACNPSSQNCRYGRGHNQIPGLLCQKPKHVARYSMHSTKRNLQVLSSKGAFCSIRKQPLSFSWVSVFQCQLLAKTQHHCRTGKRSSKAPVFFLGGTRECMFCAQTIPI